MRLFWVSALGLVAACGGAPFSTAELTHAEAGPVSAPSVTMTGVQAAVAQGVPTYDASDGLDGSVDAAYAEAQPDSAVPETTPELPGWISADAQSDVVAPGAIFAATDGGCPDGSVLIWADCTTIEL